MSLSRVKTWTNETLTASDLNAEFDNILNYLNGGTFVFSAPIDLSNSNAGQIVFPASQNASSNANTLDDYKEVTWTPTFVNLTAVGAQTHTGAYIKIGRIIVFRMKLSAATSVASTTSTYCDNFPYTISSNFMPIVTCSEDSTKTAIGLGTGNTNVVFLGAIGATSAIAVSGVVIAAA